MKLLEKAWPSLRHALWWLAYQWFYDLSWFVGRGTAPVISHITVEGGENIPRKGAMLFTANHMSQWDILYTHNLLPRPGYWMTKREYFDVPFFGGWAKLFGAFPIERGKYDREALQTTINLLKRGEIVIIFPEGTRSKNFQLGEGHSGAALIAWRADALIVPIALSGTEKISRKKEYGPDGKKLKPEVTVRVGQPYRLPRTGPDGKRPGLDEMNTLMMSKIAELLPPKYQGRYAEAVRKPGKFTG